MSEILQMEAQAFDRQILERVANGHIPDLRNTRPCDYFYNNIWRHPDYVGMYYGRAFEKVLGFIRKYCSGRPSVLEAGCGPGFISLQLAREGMDVTGMDISAECIGIAKKTAASSGLTETNHGPRYQVRDFMEAEGHYDVVLFWKTLHHFADCGDVLNKVNELLNPGGLVIIFEPTRDRVTKENVMQAYLIEQLLAMTGCYYKQPDVNCSIDEIRQHVEDLYHLQKYETHSGQKLQSVNDNESGYEQMVPALRDAFEQLEYEDGYSFFFQMIGGLRMKDSDDNRNMAHFIRMMDALMCDMKIITPTEFYFVGRKK